MFVCSLYARFSFYYTVGRKLYREEDFELIKSTDTFAEVLRGKNSKSLQEGGFSSYEKALKAYKAGSSLKRVEPQTPVYQCIGNYNGLKDG